MNTAPGRNLVARLRAVALCAVLASLPLAIAAAIEPGARRPFPQAIDPRALDCPLADSSGQMRPLAEIADRPLLVVAFIGIDCPMARWYAPRLDELADRYRDAPVRVVGVNANAGDSAADVRDFSQRCGCRFPIYKDIDQRLADALGASRQLEIFVLDEDRNIAYHGRVDDQCAPGVRRPAPSRADLATAIDELLAGRTVALAETPIPGCLLDRVPKCRSENRPGEGAVSDGSRRGSEAAVATGPTYAHDIAPLLARHCVECHQPGRIGPFALTGYEDAVAWAATAKERIDAGVMPPWHADPAFGHFANERRLSDEEKRLFDAWIAAGAPRGDDCPSADATSRRSVPAAAEDAWAIGRPDRIVSIPKPVAIPAQGLLEYVNVVVDPGFMHDVWVRGAEVRPSATQSVHHCTVMIAPPGCNGSERGAQPGLTFLAGYIPGMTPSLLPPGMARRIPAGWKIHFQLHYVTTGAVTEDQTSLGLALADRPEHEVRTAILQRDDLELRPFTADQRYEQTWIVPTDMLLLAMMPHMHLRGASFRYEALYPDGSAETLLNVPQFDMMWQHHYVLAEPKRLPAGAVLRAVASFDNSAANPRNPDPSATVRVGPQTTDEMFNGWFDVAEIEPPRRTLPIAWGAVGVAAIWVVDRRRRSRRRRAYA